MKNPYISVVGRKKLPTVNDIIMNVRSCRAASRSVHHGWQQSQTCGGSDQLLEIQGKMV